MKARIPDAFCSGAVACIRSISRTASLLSGLRSRQNHVLPRVSLTTKPPGSSMAAFAEYPCVQVKVGMAASLRITGTQKRSQTRRPGLRLAEASCPYYSPRLAYVEGYVTLEKPPRDSC